MPQIINTNIASLTAQRNLNTSQSANSTALERLSSGLRINSAKDDAAGLAISTRFESQVKGLNVAIRNAGDGISLAQTAEGALGAMTENLQRIRELAVQSANATNSDDDRVALQQEVSQLVSEVTRTAEQTNFNGRNLLDGTFSGIFQIGADSGQTVDVSIAELTADKLGSGDTAGVSAIGNSNALANGDLSINGVAISASQAGADTSSTDNAAASAIAKVEAINAFSSETGVTAYVDTNVVSGSEMVGEQGTTTLTLNGVEIALATSSDSTQTRASVAEAINAVSDQTGVTALNTEVDAGGVKLQASDGRNIQIQFSNSTLTNDAAATGLAAAGTYEGGYTLVADPDVGEILVEGGNATGRGDLTNSGLKAGTYDRGVATAVSTAQADITAATDLSASGGSLTNTIGDTGDTATLIGAGATYTNTIHVSGPTALVNTTATNEIHFRLSTAGGALTELTISAGSSMNDFVTTIDGVNGIKAFEQIDFQVTGYQTETGGNLLYMAGQTIALPDDAAGAGYDSTGARLEFLTNAINTTTFAAGVTVSAELNFAKTAVDITIRNENAAGTIELANGSGAAGAMVLLGTMGIGGGGANLTGLGNANSMASASIVVGQIGFEASASTPVTVEMFDSSAGIANNDFFTGSTAEFTTYGNVNLSSTSKNVVSVSVDGVNQADTTINEDATVADLATTINAQYDDVNAWEQIELTFDNTNLQVGDTLYIGTPSATSSVDASGVAIAIVDSDADGTVTISDVADAINSSDFSGSNIEVGASINTSGTQLTLSIRNFSSNEVRAVTDADGRSLQTTTGDLIGGKEQSFSGSLAYSATGTQEISLTMSDTKSTGEFYTGASVSTSYTGVNGLSEGDLVINDVNIGAAIVAEDTASAEFASDNTRILSSTKEKSGIAIAAAINEVSGETGVSATVNATEVVGGDASNIPTAGSSTFAVGDTAEIYINGYTAGIVTLQDNGAGAIDTDRAKADALALVNGISGKTGVVGVDNGVSLTLSAADGRNISVAIDDQSGSDASIGAIFGLDAAVEGIGESTFGDEPALVNRGISAESATYETTYSTIKLESAGEFEVKFGSEGADELTSLGLQEGKFGGASDGTFLKDVDVSTFEGAQAAITAIDNALKTVSSQRAELGALQNRFESTSSNLQITSENLASANSRIRDADFAAETAELSRTQVLQQAGISILAQANQRPQQVLSLLG